MSPTIQNQARLAGIALAAGLAWTALGSGTALAVSPSQEECELAGGTFTKEQGEVQCVTVDKVGNQPEHSQGQTTTTDESGQGNITPKEGELVCSGPPGQQDPACP